MDEDYTSKIIKTDGPDLLGHPEITIDECFRVKEINIFRQATGYRIAMPRVRLNSGKFKEIASALDLETQKMVEDAVIAEYEKLAGEPMR